MLDFRIKTFLCVCQTMNYTQAAKLLNITQPAVSQHIRFLEDYYQIKAFRYANKKLELTAAGRILFERCKTMENDEVALSAELLSSQSGIRTLSLGVTMTVGEYAIISPLAAYQLAHPGINIRLRFGNTQELLAQLTAGRIQMALVEGYFPPRDYFCRPYSTEPYIGVCASNHQFKTGQPATFHDLLGERLLLREKGSGTREILERNLALHGLKTTDFIHNMEVENMHTIIGLLTHDCGISFLYRRAVQAELASGRLREIPLKNFSMEHDFTFIWEKDSIYTAEYQQICQELSSTP
ncbi:DNA-binding transcriptional regulator, LysR family [Selenomonas sp. GACV-9]|uniref:LysR family transcriptional regulator n=1 Tax=Selenomonas sp. GACV-9 TaxID=3158782 RepID=UPI0008EBFC52|nr:DNA-binding transcriptional regulator, LysR family [Selenomonas ruminantium]